MIDIEHAVLAELAEAPNGLSTKDLAERLRPGSMSTMPRGEFGRFAAEFGRPLSDLIGKGLVHRGAMHAGWRITEAGQEAHRKAKAAATPAPETEANPSRASA